MIDKDKMQEIVREMVEEGMYDWADEDTLRRILQKNIPYSKTGVQLIECILIAKGLEP